MFWIRILCGSWAEQKFPKGFNFGALQIETIDQLSSVEEWEVQTTAQHLWSWDAQTVAQQVSLGKFKHLLNILFLGSSNN